MPDLKTTMNTLDIIAQVHVTVFEEIAEEFDIDKDKLMDFAKIRVNHHLDEVISEHEDCQDDEDEE